MLLFVGLRVIMSQKVKMVSSVTLEFHNVFNISAIVLTAIVDVSILE